MSRMIDLDKLIQECSAMKGNGCSDDKCKHNTCDTTSVSQCIKKIAESIVEPEIDFDALWKEYEEKYSCKKTANCDNCTYPNKLYYTTICFVDFLKSKNLTVPKSVEIPVKRTWTLKKEYYRFAIDMFQPISLMETTDKEPKHTQYYDLKEDPDYSKITKGSIVEIEFFGCNGNKCGYVNGITNKSISIGFHMLYNSGNSTTINFDQIKSIVILKLAKE